jgi:hypothetical protein
MSLLTFICYRFVDNFGFWIIFVTIKTNKHEKEKI